MTSTQHLSLAQHLATDVVIQLFTLDLTVLNTGYGVYSFTPGTLNGEVISYQGVGYTPIPIQATGFELTSQGAQPRPKLTISNIGGFAASLVIGASDLLGANLYRLRTFQRFLDGQPDADPDAHWPQDQYVVDRKSAQNKTTIEFELATQMDAKNLKIPGILALANNCQQRYRGWVPATESFSYAKATCPYTGGSYYNLQDASQSDPSQDSCGKRLSSCRLRFGSNGTLPFVGFPAMTPQ
jgi:lambda family phage minor tail protein L